MKLFILILFAFTLIATGTKKLTINDTQDRTFTFLGSKWGMQKRRISGIGIAQKNYSKYFFGPFGSVSEESSTIKEFCYYVVISFPILLLLSILYLVIKKIRKVEPKNQAN